MVKNNEINRIKYFPLRLKAIRAELGLSRRALSEKTGIPVDSYAAMEYAVRLPNYNNISKFFYAFPEYTAYLLYGNNKDLPKQIIPKEKS